jgi:hypothetical protein
MQEDQPGEEDKKVKQAGLVTFDRSYTASHQTPLSQQIFTLCMEVSEMVAGNGDWAPFPPHS